MTRVILYRQPGFAPLVLRGFSYNRFWLLPASAYLNNKRQSSASQYRSSVCFYDHVIRSLFCMNHQSHPRQTAVRASLPDYFPYIETIASSVCWVYFLCTLRRIYPVWQPPWWRWSSSSLQYREVCMDSIEICILFPGSTRASKVLLLFVRWQKRCALPVERTRLLI